MTNRENGNYTFLSPSLVLVRPLKKVSRPKIRDGYGSICSPLDFRPPRADRKTWTLSVSTIATAKSIPYPITAFVELEIWANAKYVTNANSMLVIVATGTVLIVDLEEFSSDSMYRSSCWRFVIRLSDKKSEPMFPFLRVIHG